MGTRRKTKFNVHARGASKYRNQRVTVDGIQFDSKHEAKRWQELVLMEKAGVIRDLYRQVRIGIEIGGVKVVYESGRQLTYVCDFQYYDVERDREVIEDAKGFATREYRIKKALLAAMGKTITEV